MYSDNDRLRSQLAARNADVSSLLDRAAQYERQSRVAQDELESIRLRMHNAATTHSDLDTLPEAPMRYDHIPGQLGARTHPSELVCPYSPFLSSFSVSALFWAFAKDCQMLLLSTAPW